MARVRLKNHSEFPFSGWLRTTVEGDCPVAGWSDGAQFVRGRKLGHDLHALDVQCTLQPGEQIEFDTDYAAPALPNLGPLPADPVAWTGGLLSVGGFPMQLLSVTPDGASYQVHAGLRAGPLLLFEVWLRYYPGQSWATGELMVTASNPASGAMHQTVPPVHLSFGDAVTVVAGQTGPILPQGTRLADGQAKILPIGFYWQRHDPAAAGSFAVAANCLVSGVGIETIFPGGNPTYPANYDPQAMATRYPDAMRRLRTWEHPLYGPSPRSSNTGAQEDQVFVRGEALLPNGLGCEVVTYLSALKMAERPCHHLEVEGTRLDPDRPRAGGRLLFWDGRPHPITSVSPERLGKPRTLADHEAEMRWGPDIEHWLINTLTAAYRYTGSHALQRLLEHHAVIYLLQRTANPGWSTSGIFSSREIGWEGLLVTHLSRHLQDATLREAVETRWRERFTNILAPQLGSRPHDVWDVRIDPRLDLPPGQPGWMPWQQSIAAYGMWLACQTIGPAPGISLAYRAALRCVESNWVQLNGRWRGIGNQPFPPREPETFGADWFMSRVDWFETTWDLPALAVVLAEDPGHQKANAIWSEVKARLPWNRSWVPPQLLPWQVSLRSS